MLFSRRRFLDDAFAFFDFRCQPMPHFASERLADISSLAAISFSPMPRFRHFFRHFIRH